MGYMATPSQGGKVEKNQMGLCQPGIPKWEAIKWATSPLWSRDPQVGRNQMSFGTLAVSGCPSGIKWVKSPLSSRGPQVG